ncbi:adenylate/guanylate cyclase domain-containing protein [Limibacter armeniacum]|uniref:adenylate/guanylate cyclase domain-containing protein n=1 Tax=Limibacter armeniacum TaxID=466084 RepID=UPI002FE5C740
MVNYYQYKTWKSLFHTLITWILAVQLFRLIRLVGITEYESDSMVTSIFKQTMFDHSLLITTIIGAAVGVLFWLNQYIFKKVERKYMMCYANSLIYRGVSFLTAVIIAIVLSLIILAVAATHYNNVGLVDVISIFIFDKTILVFSLYILVWATIINLIAQIKDKLGPGVFFHLMTGKYQIPKEEDRIFMFIDLNNSTQLAEKLGHLKYSQMLQEYYRDLTDSIFKYGAEVYQYVGDEVVLTWKTKEGLKKANFIRLFFDFQDKIKQKAQVYTDKYGVVPSFKAGANMGLVTVAEVGIIKKEIAYHSDVLNTASRLMYKCQELHEKFLITEKLAKAIPSLVYVNLGSVPLKGKSKEVNVCAIRTLKQLQANTSKVIVPSGQLKQA